MTHDSRTEDHHHAVEAASRIRRYAETRHLSAGALAQAIGLPPGQARAIINGFADTVPVRTLQSAARSLPD